MNILEPDYQPRPQQPAPAQAKPTARSGSVGFAEYFVSRPETIWSQPPSTTPPAVPTNARPAVAAPDDYVVSRPETIWSPQSASTPSPTGAVGAKNAKQITMWDGGKFDIYDVLDVINPLQHIPVVSTIYRENTGDQIGAVPRVLGSMLFGFGPVGAVIGAAAAAINLVIEGETGKDIGGHIYTALFGDKKQTAPAAAVAATPPAAPSQAVIKDAKPSPASTAGSAGTGGSTVPVGAPIAAPPPPARGTVSNKFRLSEWYRRNQVQLETQARELAKARAAHGYPTGGAAATPKRADSKPVELVPGSPAPAESKPGEAKPGEPTGAMKPDLLTLFDAREARRPKEATSPAGGHSAQPPVPGPWVADQMQKALRKYQHLMKSRTPRAPTIDKQG